MSLLFSPIVNTPIFYRRRRAANQKARGQEDRAEENRAEKSGGGSGKTAAVVELRYVNIKVDSWMKVMHFAGDDDAPTKKADQASGRHRLFTIKTTYCMYTAGERTYKRPAATIIVVDKAIQTALAMENGDSGDIQNSPANGQAAANGQPTANEKPTIKEKRSSQPFRRVTNPGDNLPEALRDNSYKARRRFIVFSCKNGQLAF